MAKNKIAAKRLGTKHLNLPNYRKILLFVIIAFAVFLIGMMLLFPKSAFKSPATESGVSEASGIPLSETPVKAEKKALAGQAIGGFEALLNAELATKLVLNNLPNRGAGINPTSATAIIDSANQGDNSRIPFTIEVIVQPVHPDAAQANVPNAEKYDEMTVELDFDSSKLELIGVKLPQNTELAVFIARMSQGETAQNTQDSDGAAGTMVRTTRTWKNLDAQNPGIVGGNGKKTSILEFEFKPKADVFGDTTIILHKVFLVPPGGGGGLSGTGNENTGVIADGAEGKTATISIKKKWYKDLDNDGFGNEVGDADSYSFAADGNPINGHVADNTDCNDNDRNINPRANEDHTLCNDRTDNDCDGQVDETTPTCGQITVAGAAIQCGFHRVCSDNRLVDCNKNAAGGLVAGKAKCNILNGLAFDAASNWLCLDNGRCFDNVQGDGRCVNNAGDLAACQANLGAAEVRLTQFNLFTPGCGIDSDNDGNRCDAYENMLNCPEDCGSCPAEVGAACIGAGIADADNDGLSDAYETQLDLGLRAIYRTEAGNQFPVNHFYNSNVGDSDSDGVRDNVDYCPGTITEGFRTLANGYIKANGCYAGDVKSLRLNGDEVDHRPDGCFELRDFTQASPNFYDDRDVREVPAAELSKKLCSFNYKR